MNKSEFKSWCEELVEDKTTLKMLEGKGATQIVLEMTRRVGEIADCVTILDFSNRNQKYKESAMRDMAMQAACVIAACQKLIDIASE